MEFDSVHISRQQKDYLSILGYTYLKCNKLEKATIIYKALNHLFPETASFTFCLSYLYLRQEQYENALFYVDIYLSSGQKKIGLGHFIKSQALFKLGRGREAKKYMKAFLER